MTAKHEAPFKTPVRHHLADETLIVDADGSPLFSTDIVGMNYAIDYELMHKRSTAAIFAINSYAKRDEALKLAMEALEKIACFNDILATEILIRTGEYSSFDEPSSVRQSRYAISAIKEMLK
jgi:hypothetical protein